MGYILLSGLFIIENIKISALRSLVSSTQINAPNHHSLPSAIAWMNVWNVRKGSWLDPMLQLKLPLPGPLQSIKHWELILKILPYHSLLLGSSSTFPRFFSRIKYFSICFLKEVLNESPWLSLSPWKAQQQVPLHITGEESLEIIYHKSDVFLRRPLFSSYSWMNLRSLKVTNHSIKAIHEFMVPVINSDLSEVCIHIPVRHIY